MDPGLIPEETYKVQVSEGPSWTERTSSLLTAKPAAKSDGFLVPWSIKQLLVS